MGTYIRNPIKTVCVMDHYGYSDAR